VFGASGSGKSSLVKAGLLADLVLPGMIGRVALVRYAILRPSDRGGRLIEALVGAIIEPPHALPELCNPPFGDTIETLGRLLREAPRQAARPIQQGLAAAGQAAGLAETGEARLLVIVDQLEELFTHDKVPESERNAFVTALDAMAKSGLVWVVALMRSDFFDRLETMPALASLSADESRYLLLPPDQAEVGQIIRRQAVRRGSASRSMPPERSASTISFTRRQPPKRARFPSCPSYWISCGSGGAKTVFSRSQPTRNWAGWRARSGVGQRKCFTPCRRLHRKN
jgi:hypothetical protein